MTGMTGRKEYESLNVRNSCLSRKKQAKHQLTVLFVKTYAPLARDTYVSVRITMCTGCFFPICGAVSGVGCFVNLFEVDLFHLVKRFERKKVIL